MFPNDDKYHQNGSFIEIHIITHVMRCICCSEFLHRSSNDNLPCLRDKLQSEQSGGGSKYLTQYIVMFR